MSFLLLGLSLGLSAGLSPGPLMTLVITTSLRDGFGQGLRVAVAPILTDLPIILLALFVLNRLPAWTLAVLGLVGGAYVIFLGWETMQSAGEATRSLAHGGAVAGASGGPARDRTASQDIGRRSLRRGATVNLLNPHPYLFWATVGGPTLLEAYGRDPFYALAFLVGFYTLLVGSKIGVAALVHSQSHLVTGPWYRRLLVALGALLAVLGLLIIYDAITALLA